MPPKIRNLRKTKMRAKQLHMIRRWMQSNRLVGFMNSFARVFEMVDFLKDQFPLHQQYN